MTLYIHMHSSECFAQFAPHKYTQQRNIVLHRYTTENTLSTQACSTQ